MIHLDLDLVRAQFPMFADPDLDGWAFFENAGGSYPCRQVIDRLTHFYTHTKTQIGHPFPVSERAAAAVAEAPARLAAMVGVETHELQVGPSTTQNTYVLAQAFRSLVGPGDAIVVTDQDHEANSGAWRKLADAGVEIREWKVDPASGLLDLERLDALLDGTVALVAFPHVSNIVGHVNPVRTIADRAHAVGAVTIVDGVAAAPHSLPDVGALGADVYLFSTYKTFGPHQGVMTVTSELLDRLPNQGHFFNAAFPTKRLVPAGPDHAQVAALAGIVDYVDLLDRHHHGADAHAAASPLARAQRVSTLWRAHEQVLLAPLMDALRDRPGVRVIGPETHEGRAPTVAIATDLPGRDVAAKLADHRVMAAGGHFYAYRLMRALGIDPEHGVTRVSFVHNTTAAEVDQLIGALDEVR